MNGQQKISLSRLGYVIYEHPDFENFRTFAKEFGLTPAKEAKDTVYFTGYGKDQFVYVARQAPSGEAKRFIGAGFVASTAEDFEAATHIRGAQSIDTSSRPGGGKAVSIPDPNGFEMQVVWDQEERNLPSHGLSACNGGRPTVNGALDEDKYRRGEFVRMKEGPAMVHKLGHFGYDTDNYDETCNWYRSNFNIVPTEILYAPGNETLDVATFHRLDLGKEHSDHHCFLVTRRDGGRSGTSVHHSSFEVEDIDTEMMGHQWLAKNGYKLVWGVGRHIHGSQVFDYWYDSSGFIIEHYADGDVVNEDTELNRAEAGHMAVWGPPVPVIWGGKEITA